MLTQLMALVSPLAAALLTLGAIGADVASPDRANPCYGCSPYFAGTPSNSNVMVLYLPSSKKTAGSCEAPGPGRPCVEKTPCAVEADVVVAAGPGHNIELDYAANNRPRLDWCQRHYSISGCGTAKFNGEGMFLVEQATGRLVCVVTIGAICTACAGNGLPFAAVQGEAK